MWESGIKEAVGRAGWLCPHMASGCAWGGSSGSLLSLQEHPFSEDRPTLTTLDLHDLPEAFFPSASQRG